MIIAFVASLVEVTLKSEETRKLMSSFMVNIAEKLQIIR